LPVIAGSLQVIQFPRFRDIAIEPFKSHRDSTFIHSFILSASTSRFNPSQKQQVKLNLDEEAGEAPDGLAAARTLQTAQVAQAAQAEEVAAHQGHGQVLPGVERLKADVAGKVGRNLKGGRWAAQGLDLAPEVLDVLQNQGLLIGLDFSTQTEDIHGDILGVNDALRFNLLELCQDALESTV
jgi:hypothetical protein